MPNDLKKFREAGVDAFTGGFQVGAPRTYKRKPQTWANSNLEIKRILLTAFPQQATKPRQRERAGRWLRVIHLCLRLSYTYRQAAEDMGTTMNAVRMILRTVNRVRKGLTQHGTPRSLNKAGRPKKQETQIPSAS